MSLNHKKCNWIQCGNMSLPQLSHRVGIHVPPFWQMQIRFWALNFGPAQLAGHRWTKARTKFLGICARIRSSPQCLSRSMPCLFSPSLLLWLNPDAATITAVNLALQRLSAGPFHSIPSALLRRGSACGLKIDVDGIQLASKAAHSCCFRMRCFVSRHGAHKSCKRLRWQNP